MYKKICKNCQSDFIITDEDRLFYNKIDVPEPTWCPDCRCLRRWSWRNERFLYPRKCDHCQKPIISVFNPNHPYIVYCQDCYNADDWSGEDYGQDINWDEKVIDQIARLFLRPPYQGVFVVASQNCEYNNFANYSKSCYMCCRCYYSEECYYCFFIKKSKNCVDCHHCFSSELCYDCYYCDTCYNVKYSEQSDNCLDSYFLSHCSNCRNCFNCYNLRHQSYCINNRQVSPEEYNNFIKKINFGARRELKKWRAEFVEFKNGMILRENHNIKSDGCLGDYLNNCHNAFHCFTCNGSENVRYCYDSSGGEGGALKDSMDCMIGHGELCYDSATGEDAYACFCCFYVLHSHHQYYCRGCVDSSYLFGCIGLKNKKYCIFNKQYTEEEYNQLLPRLIEKMKREGDFGQFFPPAMSPHGYNETVAMENFPLTRDEVIAKGWRWQDDLPGVFGQETIKDIPDDISEVGDKIIDEVLLCRRCQKNFKVIPQELKFYRDRSIPLPEECPNCRYLERARLRNPYKLWDRNCDKCGKEIKTTYAPERPEKIYCSDCYRKEIY